MGRRCCSNLRWLCLAAMGSKTCILLEIGLLALTVCVHLPLFAQAKTPAHPQEISVQVPFVGCASDGQVGPVKAPRGKSKVVSVAADVANRLAYYKAEQGPAVLAPRGWYCFCTYGSNGAALYVSSRPINKEDLFSANWSGFVGPVVEIGEESGDTSGRFGVARIIARVFPARKEFVDKVMQEEIEPENEFPFGPYPSDKLKYKSKEAVEYQTPAETDGLGTGWRLRKNGTPISGVAILVGPTPDLVFLAVRLPTRQADLTPAIIHQVESDARHPDSVTTR